MSEFLLLLALCFLGNALFITFMDVTDRRPFRFLPRLGAVAVWSCVPILGQMTAVMGLMLPVMALLILVLERKNII